MSHTCTTVLVLFGLVHSRSIVASCLLKADASDKVAVQSKFPRLYGIRLVLEPERNLILKCVLGLPEPHGHPSKEVAPPERH